MSGWAGEGACHCGQARGKVTMVVLPAAGTTVFTFSVSPTSVRDEAGVRVRERTDSGAGDAFTRSSHEGRCEHTLRPRRGSPSEQTILLSYQVISLLCCLTLQCVLSNL